MAINIVNYLVLTTLSMFLTLKVYSLPLHARDVNLDVDNSSGYNEHNYSQNSPKILFLMNGKQFSLEVNSDYVQLKQVKTNNILGKVRAQQYEYGKINELALAENNWLWINGDETDYMARVDVSKSIPTIEPPVKLPDLYVNQCHILFRIWGSCIRAQGHYDPVSGHITIEGHPKSLFGFTKLKTLEIVDGVVSPSY